ncbi:hypothetical protein J4206_01335 [Candidatus Woesearchaeota archaeon]|nr:hypothetical protein [Candidatus Woesearchaeota archaeon]
MASSLEEHLRIVKPTISMMSINTALPSFTIAMDTSYITTFFPQIQQPRVKSKREKDKGKRLLRLVPPSAHVSETGIEMRFDGPYTLAELFAPEAPYASMVAFFFLAKTGHFDRYGDYGKFSEEEYGRNPTLGVVCFSDDVYQQIAKGTPLLKSSDETRFPYDERQIDFSFEEERHNVAVRLYRCPDVRVGTDMQTGESIAIPVQRRKNNK